MTRRPPLATGPALAVVVAVLVAANVARTLVVPDGAHLAFNLAVGVVVLGVGVAAGMTRTELGVDRAGVGSGLRWGGAALLAVTAVVGVAALVPAAEGLFEDDRTRLTAGEAAWRVLVAIPLGTVVVEEVAFRGVLQGLLGRRLDRWTTIGVGALLFGLWHLLPVWEGGGDDSVTGGGGAGIGVALAGTFVATSLAGVAFGWLRDRSGSLLAPIGLHLATNSVVFAVAWALAR